MTPPASQRQDIVLVDEEWAATLISLHSNDGAQLLVERLQLG